MFSAWNTNMQRTRQNEGLSHSSCCTEHGRESLTVHAGFMDNLLSVFPPRPEGLLHTGPKRCQAISTKHVDIEGVNEGSCLLPRCGWEGKDLSIFLLCKELLISASPTMSRQIRPGCWFQMCIFISNAQEICYQG